MLVVLTSVAVMSTGERPRAALAPGAAPAGAAHLALNISGTSHVKPTLFLHFHKAGGTTMCGLFRAAGYRSPSTAALGLAGNCFCLAEIADRDDRTNPDADATGGGGGAGAGAGTQWAPFSNTPGLSDMVAEAFSGDRRLAGTLLADMASTGQDICMLEQGRRFPPPKHWSQFARAFRGVIATTIRDPWLRFRSSKEGTSSTSHALARTVAPFARPPSRCEQYVAWWLGEGRYRQKARAELHPALPPLTHPPTHSLARSLTHSLRAAPIVWACCLDPSLAVGFTLARSVHARVREHGGGHAPGAHRRERNTPWRTRLVQQD